jgi:hypothetical protein
MGIANAKATTIRVEILVELSKDIVNSCNNRHTKNCRMRIKNG